MRTSRREPRPVPIRRYRYSRWRWRVLVRLLDTAGGLAARIGRWVRPPVRVESPQRILVVQLDHLGDAVLSTPLFPRLREAYPEARIDVLASASNRAFIEADPHVDRVHVAERNWFERRPGGRAPRRPVPAGRDPDSRTSPPRVRGGVGRCRGDVSV